MRFNTGTDSSGRTIRRKLVVGILAATAAVIVVVIAAIAVFGGRSRDAVARLFIKAYYEGDAKAYVKMMVPNKNPKERFETMKPILQEDYERIAMEFGEGWSYSYEIFHAEGAYDQDSSMFKNSKEYYKEKYNIEITAEDLMVAVIHIKSDKGEWEFKVPIPIVKIGRSWYFDPHRTIYF